MSHEQEPLVWYIDGSQDFLVRLGQDKAIKDGASIVTITSITLQKRTGIKPESWSSTGVTAASAAITTDDFDEDNPVSSAAVYFEGSANPAGVIPDAGPYRWFGICVLDNGLDLVFDVPVVLR